MDFLTGKIPPLQYSPLEPGTKSFRLVKLLSPGHASSVLPFCKYPRVKIIEANVDDVGRYDALSYAWSHSVKSRSNCRVVVVTKDGDQELPINASLEAALLTLAESRGDGRPLFIDQICINQADNNEKSEQVRHMGEIYTNSVLTIIWLGPHTRDSTVYFDYTRKVGTKGILSRVMGPNAHNFPVVFKAILDPEVEVDGAQAEDRDAILALIAEYGDTYPVRGLREVLQRVWFNRLWVIQEICLSTNVVFVCGDRMLCFDCFRSGVLFFTMWNTWWLKNRKTRSSTNELRLRKEVLALTQPLIRIIQERMLLSKGVKPSLYHLVIKYNINHDGAKVGATLGEDRIFGLLGIAENDALKQAATVRYGDVGSVYIRFAAAAAKESPDVLLFSQFPKSIPGLPSWVPDWAMGQMTVPYGYSVNMKTAFYSAGGSKNEQQRLTYADNKTLIVRGFLVDRIVKVGDDNSSINQPPKGNFVGNMLDYPSVHRRFVQTDQYLDTASQIASCPFPYSLDSEQRTLCAIRLSDAGLTAKTISRALPAEQVVPFMHRMHRHMYHMGEKYSDIRHVVESYHLGSIVQTAMQKLGSLPWYWAPASEVDALQLCAVRPLEAGAIWFQGAWRFAFDIVSLLLASLVVQWSAWFPEFRARFAKIDIDDPNREQVFKKMGFDSDVLHSAEWKEYTANVLKTARRRLFLTEHGYIGLGPMLLQENDLVSVVFGMTTPIILRPCEVLHIPERDRTEVGQHDNGEATVKCSYIGESYCDGIMDGERCGVSETERVVTFEIS